MTRAGRNKRLNFRGKPLPLRWWAPALIVAAALSLQLGGPEARGARPAGMPLLIAANRGQWEAGVHYAARWAGGAILFTGAGPVLSAGGRRIAVEFEGTAGPLRVEAAGAQPTRIHYLHGRDPETWIRDVPTYQEVIYRELYPGIDLHYRASPEGLKTEFVVAPGADPRQIRWTYSGARGVTVDGSGNLVVDLGGASVVEAKPVIYQGSGDRRTQVKGGYAVSEGVVSFRLGRWDPSLRLIVDPVVSFSTYLGGSGLDSLRAIAVDSARNVYVAGYTDSRDLPVANALQGQSGGGVDAFVAKLSVAGSLVYLTYLGGSGDDRAFGIAVDGSGAAYVTGWTYSANFPTSAGARQRVLGGGRDAFVAKLNSAGSGLVYSTFLGGANHDSGNAVAVDPAGNAYVAGDTFSSDFPVLSPFQSSGRGRQEAFVSKLNATGSALVWSTYLGGYGDDRATAAALDAAANVYVTGATDSPNFPTQAPLQGPAGGQDAFVAKLSSDGVTLVYSTYLGGSGGTATTPEAGLSLQVDRAGNAYVAGVTPSLNFPVANAFQGTYNGGTLDGFVAKLNPQGSGLVYSTYLGGAGVDYATAVSVNWAGVAAVAGYTASPNFPVLGGPQGAPAGSYDAFVVRLNPQGGGLEAATYLGGSGSDAAYGVFVDPAGNTWVAGQTGSVNFPVRNAAQSVNAGSLGGFVTKLGELTPSAVFRGADNALWITNYSARIMRSAGGYFASEAASAQQAPTGDVFAAIRNAGGQVWLNVFDAASQSWRGWVYVGESAVGNPAVAAPAGGDVYVVSRTTASSSYWLKRYRIGAGVTAWIDLGGSFASDPAAAAASDGSIYICGTTSSGAVAAGIFSPASGFGGWNVSAGAAAGVPAVTVGSDGAAYMAARTPQNTVAIARFSAAGWGGWFDGGGTLAADPDVAATRGAVYVSVRSSDGAIWIRPFLEGTTNGWQPWVSTGGYLTTASVAAAQGRFHVLGYNGIRDLWWYDSGAGWVHYGFQSLMAGRLSATPK